MQTAMRWKYHTDFTVCSDQGADSGAGERQLITPVSNAAASPVRERLFVRELRGGRR